MEKQRATARMQHRHTGQWFLVEIEVDFNELALLYAQNAMDNKQRKARVAHGAVTLRAQETAAPLEDVR